MNRGIARSHGLRGMAADSDIAAAFAHDICYRCAARRSHASVV
jgi:hypothetical protein